ncbi:MAG: hypothetical protein WCC92_01360 [Candidatus Korobacteraceae bacterium]
MIRYKAKILGTIILALGVLVLCGLPLVAQNSASSPQPAVNRAVRFAVSPPLRELAKLPQHLEYGFHMATPVRSIRLPDARKNRPLSPDPVEQNSVSGAAGNYSIGLNLLGVGYGFPNYVLINAPPDTNLAVGDTQLVEWINSSFAIFNKTTGATEAGPFNGHTLFTALGGDCANGFQSDPIAQWDNAAHRWLLAQNTFSNPFHACVAISQTPDALGSYYLYSFPLGGFPDYPKWGRWTNSWTQTYNSYGPNGLQFVGAVVCVYDRTKLLAGDPTTGQKCFPLGPGDYSLLPADIDSPANPPAGEDIFLIGGLGMVNSAHLSLYSVHIDWSNPGAATITGTGDSQLIAVPNFNPACNGSYRAFCVPQKDISDTLDSLGDRLMYRFAYYDDPFPTHPSTSIGSQPYQHWYVNHAVTASGGQMGTRWYEFRALQQSVPVTSMTVYQAGTFAPDSNYRWMGSMAQDKMNDILLGYSISSASMYPSINVAGRVKTDPPSTLEPELVIINGTGSQTDTGGRWGDYSSMSIDQDGCTFWYVAEYYMLTTSLDWSSQIASLKFTNCH